MLAFLLVVLTRLSHGCHWLEAQLGLHGLRWAGGDLSEWLGLSSHSPSSSAFSLVAGIVLCHPKQMVQGHLEPALGDNGVTPIRCCLKLGARLVQIWGMENQLQLLEGAGPRLHGR